MIKFFRKIRQRLLAENKFTKYLLYAFGEIVLVVIGILIALQINNSNEAKKERAREISYLRNLKADLHKEVENNERFATYHFEKAETCSLLLTSGAPKTIEDVQVYTDRYELVFIWFAFVPNNNTFKELLSSGNLSLIQNDPIKNGLLELDKLYANITSTEHHMRREYEAYLYDTAIKNVSSLGFFDMTNPKFGMPDRLAVEDIPESAYGKLIADAQWQHNDQTFQNGLKLALMNNGVLADMHSTVKQYIQELILLIDEEIDS
jgi:hypothetical protein